MKDQNYDLAVAYRVYPKISKSPPIFHGNKYLLARLCLKTFKKSYFSVFIP